MRWNNIKLIFWREVRDQLRDRRTLFTVAVLPLLLYPLLGMSFLQMAQFLREHPTRIMVVGRSHLPAHPPLIIEGQFNRDFCPPTEQRLLELELNDKVTDPVSTEVLGRQARRDIHDGRYDAMIFIPPRFQEELERVRQALRQRPRGSAESPDAPHDTGGAGVPPATSAGEPRGAPEPLIISNTASDRSRIAARRAEHVLSRWREAIVQGNLRDNQIPIAATQPFEVVEADVAEEVSRRAALWSKILPFIVMIWALTGAFYPAVDLCAGEKERGTLETLLCSPAQRGEIVWGKLLTVMTFSTSTSLLNLACITITGTFFVRQLEMIPGMESTLRVGAPPVWALSWLVLALIPLAALFSALSMAIASLARSSREGQYYLMPLLMVCLPLMMLPMLPSAELDLGTAFVPITGVMLLLRSLIEGQYTESLAFMPPVAGVTVACCWLAIRWAVDQFNNESVLFRESERLDLRNMLVMAYRHRSATPTLGQAALCGIVLLLARFFATFFLSGGSDSWSRFAAATLLSQVGLIAIPVVAMSLLLTRSLPDSLLLKPTSLGNVLGAALLAITLHPVGFALAGLIRQMYPLSPQLLEEMQRLKHILEQAPGTFSVVVLLAVVPAVCEELAFRGFILTGLRQSGRPWLAILISSFLFGAVHGILQQSIVTFILGLVIGFLAVRTGSLVPTITFHALYNGLAMVFSLEAAAVYESNPLLTKVMVKGDLGTLEYHPAVAATSGLLAIMLLVWFNNKPVEEREEEVLRRALDEAPSGPAVK